MSMIGYKSETHPQQTSRRGALDEIDDRGTDAAFFAQVSARFGGFTLDVAAAPHNAKTDLYFTRADNGLEQSWGIHRVWCNPPYSRTLGISTLDMWVEKAWREWALWPAAMGTDLHRGHGIRKRNPSPTVIVMLVPANRVEQAWWQTWVEPYRDRPGSPLRVEFLPGRLRFDQPEGWEKPTKGDRPPFGCALLIWSTDVVISPGETP